MFANLGSYIQFLQFNISVLPNCFFHCIVCVCIFIPAVVGQDAEVSQCMLCWDLHILLHEETVFVITPGHELCVRTTRNELGLSKKVTTLLVQNRKNKFLGIS